MEPPHPIPSLKGAPHPPSHASSSAAPPIPRVQEKRKRHCIMLAVLVAPSSSLVVPSMPPPATAAAAASGLSAAASSSRRQVLALGLGSAALSLFSPAARAEEVADPRLSPSCPADCFRECDIVAPGNQKYCKEQCDDYCATAGPTGKDDVLRGDPSEAAAVKPLAVSTAKDCSQYKTDAAKAYCEKETRAAAAAAAGGPKNMNNGIFGDSGVSYSSGVEDLLATAFGATRQNKNVNEANVDEYGGEILNKAQKAFFGK